MAETVFCQWCAGEPGDHHPECPFGRAEQAERERDEARPVLEAARYQAMIHGSKIAYREACYQTELAISSFDAARTAEGGEDGQIQT
jgi:hypothetical protein